MGSVCARECAGFQRRDNLLGRDRKKGSSFFLAGYIFILFFWGKKTTGKYRYSRVSFRSGDLAGFLPDDV